jgi:site-specific recombinase XerD
LLSASEARALWRSPDAETLKGKRDREVIAVLLGCGLRRREWADLTLDHLQRREDHWAIVDLVGKGGHVRTVPVPDWVKQFLDEWIAGAEISNGKLFRCVCRSGTVWGDGMTEKVVWHVVKDIRQETGNPEASASRSQEVVCTVLPRCRRRIGTNSILARARVRTNNRALPGMQTKVS